MTVSSEIQKKKCDEWVEVYIPFIDKEEELDPIINSYIEKAKVVNMRKNVSSFNNVAYCYNNVERCYEVDIDGYYKAYVNTVKDLLSVEKLQYVKMGPPVPFDFSSRLSVQIKKDELWKLYEEVKNTTYYEREVNYLISSYMNYYNKSEFYFSSKDCFYNKSPLVFEAIIKAMLYKTLQLATDESDIAMKLFSIQESKNSIINYIFIAGTIYSK